MIPRVERGERDRLQTLQPAYFALVMATGIVAIAAQLHGVAWVPTILFWLNCVFLVVLVAATVARLLRYRKKFAADVRSHSRSVGFFTLVAACGVFSNQLALRVDALGLATVFWVMATVLWVVVTYGVLAVLTVESNKPELADGLNSGWLVSVVATQSIAIATVMVLPSPDFAGVREPMMFAALALWLGGGALYTWLMTLIFLRYTFLRTSPEDLTPPYWINMGAMAISTLAGATLVEHADWSPVVMQLIPFIKGFTLVYWAAATWWIPMLVVLGVWRYIVRGVPFAYDPLYWGGVFPLGMYSVCTYQLTQILPVPFLAPLSDAFMIASLIAWAITFIGLLDGFFNPLLNTASRNRHAS